MKYSKKLMMRSLKYLAVAVPLALSANISSAGTATGNLPVTAIVSASCVVVTTPVVFGVYDPTSSSPDDATGTIEVTCTPGNTYFIALDAGANPSTSGDVNTRRMKATLLSNSYLPYQLYLDPGRTTVWGDGNNSSSVNPTSGTYSADGLPHIYTVYGRITPGNYVAADTYADTVLVTVNYN